MDAAEISFKISFLRSMVSSMTDFDREIFQDVCHNLINGRVSDEDLSSLNTLFEKFDKPAGNERI